MQGNTIAFINKEHVFSPSGITLRRFINGCFLDLSGSAVAALMHSSTGPQKPVLSVPPIPPNPIHLSYSLYRTSAARMADPSIERVLYQMGRLYRGLVAVSAVALHRNIEINLC